MRRDVAVWAWHTSNTANFGDELGPEILRRMGYNVRRVEDVSEADVVACGSVLEHVAQHARPGTIVWGAGLAADVAIDVSHLDVRAVRGELTRKRLSLEIPTGDPGCLVPEFWPRPATQRRLGVLRHYVDRNARPWADGVITADASVDDVIDFIGSCEMLASSSLHGLAVATAWGIPTLRLYHPEVAGGNFKWIDWFSGKRDPAKLLAVL